MLLGVEARELRKGDRIVGMGTVATVKSAPDGDIALRLDPTELHEHVHYPAGAWLRIERAECSCHSPDCAAHGGEG